MQGHGKSEAEVFGGKGLGEIYAAVSTLPAFVSSIKYTLHHHHHHMYYP